MSTRVTIDPITRIEGHLRIDLEVDGGTVKSAWSSGTMWRGIETILQGRDPREAWIFTQRICGVCTTVHAITSVRAVENALGLEIPLNAQYIRNLIILAHGLHDHIVHFYHLCALNWQKLYQVKELLEEVAAFVQQVYFPDLCAVGGLYADWARYGSGVTDYLSVPDLPLDTKGTRFDMPGGTIVGGVGGEAKAIAGFKDDYFASSVTESSRHAY